MSADTKVYEAFTPSGTEAPEWSAGLFVGEASVIREWVAQNSPFWRADQVRLSERAVMAITPDRLNTLRRAQKEADRLRARIKELEQSR